jgi:hypothetical protein
MGDVNGDGHLDLVTANGGNSVSVLLGRGDGTFAATREVTVGDFPLSITVGDFNGDGRPDLATANSNVDSVSVLLGRGDGTFQTRRDFGVGRQPTFIATGDFDGDGRPDLTTASDDAGTLSTLLNDTPGVVVNDLLTFEPRPSTFTFTPDPTGCPTGFVGSFRFEARLTNSSERSLSTLMVAITRLTNFNLLQNADGGPVGTGARLTVPRDEGLANGVLRPAEGVDVPFVICLLERRPFLFEVAVLGTAE